MSRHDMEPAMPRPWIIQNKPDRPGGGYLVTDQGGIGKVRVYATRADVDLILDAVNRLGVAQTEGVVGNEPNGSHTERSNRDALAELGARVLEILALTELPAGFDAPDKIGAIGNEAERLGLNTEAPRG